MNLARADAGVCGHGGAAHRADGAPRTQAVYLGGSISPPLGAGGPIGSGSPCGRRTPGARCRAGRREGRSTPIRRCSRRMPMTWNWTPIGLPVQGVPTLGVHAPGGLRLFYSLGSHLIGITNSSTTWGITQLFSALPLRAARALVVPAGMGVLYAVPPVSGASRRSRRGAESSTSSSTPPPQQPLSLFALSLGSVSLSSYSFWYELSRS